MMNTTTTKSGLKLSLFAAIAYFGGIQTPLIPVLLLGYLLLTESGAESRKTICQVLTVLGGVWLIQGGYGLIEQAVSFLNTIVGSGYLHMPYALDSFVTLVLDGVLFVFGVLALLGKQPDLRLSAVEKTVAKVQANGKTAQKPEGDDK